MSKDYLDKWEERQKQNTEKMEKPVYEVKRIFNMFGYKILILKKDKK